jgi:RNA polymerase sigma-70 factor (ECF subfamily)
MTPESTTDQEYMLRLVAGEDQALNELMNRYQLPLFQYLYRCLQNEDDAKDIAQETFVRVYEHKRKYNPRHKFSTWLYSIASNLVRNLYRWRIRHPTISLDQPLDQPLDQDNNLNIGDKLPSTHLSPAEQLQRTETVDLVQQAIQDLPIDLREALVLAEHENLSQQEIAEIQSCSRKAVENRICRAKTQLRQTLYRLLQTEPPL